MQSDSMQFSTFERLKESSNQAAAQSTPIRSYDCTKCPLIFKSKVYLYEHLNKVHCLDVDAALRGAGLKYAESNKAGAESGSGRSSGKPFECKLCDFKSLHRDVFNRHEKRCQRTENLDLVEAVVISEDPDSEGVDVSTNQCNEASEMEDDPLFPSVKSTSNTKCAPNASKDIKTYKRPQQTITKFLTASTESPHPKLADETKAAPTSQEAPSSCSPSSSAECKVRAKSLIDISLRGTFKFLQNDQLLITDHVAPKPKDGYKEIQSSVTQSADNQSSEGPLAKKIKLSKEQTALPEQENVSKPPPVSSEFSFEVSEDEEEKKPNLNRDTSNPKVYFCKHCSYRDGSFRRMNFHYHNEHPYIRCNAAYIQVSDDQSASFRCFECPAEFVSPVDLKWHYTEKHPDAADVFKMKLNELRLVFRCFSCSFTTSVLKALREHYKEKHPDCELDNPLLFCQYSDSRSQDGLTLVETSEKTSREPSSEEAGAPCKEDRNTPSPQRPASNGADVAPYKCSKCEFMHKSAVVMHVHYQKKHPDKAVTLDKIKQLARGASRVTPEKETFQKTKDKPELSLQNKINPFSPKDAAEASEKPSEVSATNPVQNKSTTKTPSFKRGRETSPAAGKTLAASPADAYYCRFCSYSSFEIRSVLGHHYARHSMKPPVTMKGILQYSIKVRKTVVKSQIQSNAKKRVRISSKPNSRPEQVAAGASVEEPDAYADAEKLFFCHSCNFGNPSAQGVLNHQVRAHEYIITNTNSIIEYTALTREKIKKSKSDRKGSSSSTFLPLPVLNRGDEEKFFCDLCNYRHKSMVKVLSHYSKTHRSCADKAAVLYQYTSEVLRQARKNSTNQQQLEKTEKRKKTSDKPAMTSSGAAPPSAGASETQRKLKCYICSYSTQYLSLLKAHLRKTHKSKRSISDILGVCFRQGALEAGFHCEWCVFSHRNSKVVFRHYQEQHPECTTNLDFIRERLCVGLNKLQLKKRKAKLNSAQRADDAGSGSGHSNDKPYPCNMCSFKGSSKSGLTRHKNEIHPAMDDKPDPLQNKGASVKSQLEDLNEMPGVFESFQVPLEDTDAAEFRCSSCPATFPTQHGLSIHCGMKHLELINVEELRKRQAKTQMRVHVFKCPHCTYVNTNYQGILAHCQMKHPDLQSRADSLHVDLEHLYNRNKYIRSYKSGEILKFKGHMCQTCPQICASRDKLNSHCEQNHSAAAPSPLQPAPQPSPVRKIKLTKPHSGHESVSKGFLQSKYSRLKCQQCSYVCTTKIGLSRHMQKQHADSASKDSVYKCSLCQLLYFSKHLLGRHYAKRHGKAAYLRYYVPVHKQADQEPEDPPAAQQQQNDSSEDKRLVFKCPKCPYVNVTYHGILTHCQMKHPAVEARADQLETGEIFVSDIVRCSNGKGTYERGYLCKLCPQIHPTLMKLKNHLKAKHGKAASEAEAEKPAGGDSPGSTMEAVSQADAPEPVPGPGPQTTPDREQPQDTSYVCQLCAFATSSRKNLQNHYKNIHKLNAASRYKLLQKYNKRNRNYLSQYAEHKRSKTVRCKTCPDLVFDSSPSLIEHYNTFHGLGSKSDFTVISLGIKRKKTTGVYRCAHCLMKLNGLRYLWFHLDRHRAEMMETAEETQKEASPTGASSDPEPSELRGRDEATAEQSRVPEEAAATRSSRQTTPSKAAEVDPEAEEEKDGLPCKHCHRLFRSLKGLRLHERSHAVMAAIKNLDNLPTMELKHDIKKIIFYKSGTLKPFRCSCCSYRTNLMALMHSHILKTHQDIIQKDSVQTSSSRDEEISQEAEKEPSDSPEKITNPPEPEEEPEETEGTLYLEPADVQRQLNHYSLMARLADRPSSGVLEATLPENCLLQCEICNFNTEHLSSIRRHYLNRHGKKMLRCKDCEFFTCSRKTLEMHVKMGHSTCQSEPTHQKDLRCPFCLYQTKNKNNMIDHIVLHREERVVPVEVRRPKLSRYLQGVVFRCHRCTFSSGSDENLRAHVARHDDVKPYQCRLCYFDCAQLAHLEAHLSDKHQVLRNHELVGQVSLDHLEARIDRMLQKNDEYDNDDKEAETEEFAADSDGGPHGDSAAERDAEEKMELASEYARGKQEQRGDEESPSKVSVSDAAARARCEQDFQARERSVSDEHPVVVKVEELNPKEGGDGVLSEARSGPEKERQKETAAGSSSTFRTADLANANRLRVRELRRSIDAKIEDDIVRHVLLLDQSHRWEHQKQAVKTEGRNVDSDASVDVSPDEDGGPALAQDQESRAGSISSDTNCAQANKARAQGGFRPRKHLLTLPPSYTQLKLSFKGGAGGCLTSCKQETHADAPEPREEMPVLEKERHKEEEEAADLELKKEEEAEVSTEDASQYRKQEVSNIHKGETTTTTTGEAAEVLREEKPFACVFCGRNLTNASELSCHVSRHRL
ncbi:zinc finger protein 462 [Kryptolebias marmoratus]|uniref:Zinc finger protein 462-like n=1 Tax=Kryptolebias marmoratus TaxID=37003 RepID=A0A3Q3F7E2_KRYMA|nr:zinc finger protein 462 [Kryptolebias marmoratus]